MFARELLERALTCRSRLHGEMDIQLHAGRPGPRLWMTLRPPGDTLFLSCDLGTVECFMATVHTVVPPCAGCDHPECAQCAPAAAELEQVLAGILEEAA